MALIVNAFHFVNSKMFVWKQIQLFSSLSHRGADNSLGLPGRKLATATNSNFYKPLKKIQNVFRPTRSPRQQ